MSFIDPIVEYMASVLPARVNPFGQASHSSAVEHIPAYTRPPQADKRR